MTRKSAVRYPDPRLQEASDILHDDPHRTIALCTDYLSDAAGLPGKSALILRSMAYEEIGDRESALEDCDRLLALEPDWFAHWHARGLVLYKLKRNEEAGAAFDRAVELDAEDWQSEYSLYYAALSYYYAGDYKAAMVRIREIPPDMPFSAFDRFEPHGPLKWLKMNVEAALRGEPHNFGARPD